MAKRSEGRGRGLLPVIVATIVAALGLAASPARAADFAVIYDARTGTIDRIVAGTRAATAETQAVLVEHWEPFPPPATFFKVDVAARRLVPNDRLEASWDSAPLRAGTGETRAIEIRKVAASGKALANDTASVEFVLRGTLRTSDAPPDGPADLPASYGTLSRVPTAFQGGRCVIEIRAGEGAGEDYLVVTQRGLEPLWVRVAYE